jgi:AcrR family transcriptional regulator
MPKIVDIESRRAAFVAASLDVIAAEGLGAATMRRIAARAGVTTGAITHYFENREALLIEAVTAAHYAAGARMKDAAERRSAAADRLEAVVLEALPLDPVRLREWRVWSEFRGALPGNAHLWTQNELGYGAWRQFLQTLLEPICGAAADDVRRETTLLVALIDGVGFRLAAMTGSQQLAAEQQTAAADVRAYLKAIGDRCRAKHP